MAVTLRHGFEAAVAGGTTISAVNSATGGNAFDSITSGAGTAATYDSTAYRGSLSGAFSSGGTSAASSANWTTSIGAAVPRCYGRTVVNGSSLAVMVDFLRCRAAGTQAFRVRLNTAGKVELRNTANTLLATSTTTISTGQWYLIRWDVTVGASATGVIHIHTDPTSATAAEVMTASSANFGAASVDEVNFGAPVSALANVGTFRHDDVVFTDVALPGPPIQSITMAETISLAEAVARGFVAPRAIAEAVSIADAATGVTVVPARGGRFRTAVLVASATPAVAGARLTTSAASGHLARTEA